MQYAELSTVTQHIELGKPLGFDIRDAERRLLLARGQVIATEAQLNALLERGAVVQSAEKTPEQRVSEATPEQLPAMWSDAADRVGRSLRVQPHDHFMGGLGEASKPVLSLVQRDADLAIFQVLRQGATGHAHYGVVHSLHTAVASYLVAKRLGWTEDDSKRAFNAAITMNLSMLDLQDKLAVQTSPLTAQQREAIQRHPIDSVAMLQACNIKDTDWLTAVEQHHEAPDGKGYPKGIKETSELASLIRRVDVYTAKLSARATRSAFAANEAGRDMFMADRGHPMAAALVKEFGVYPPGCYVKLVSGESGVVIQRGANANTPIVAALTNRNGEPLPEPVKRNTATREYSVVTVIPDKALGVRWSAEMLVKLAYSSIN